MPVSIFKFRNTFKTRKCVLLHIACIAHDPTENRYGAYGMSMPIDYHPGHACMLERGWVLAFAHVRGGGERGKAWHAAGRAQHKWNSFWDFEVGTRGCICR